MVVATVLTANACTTFESYGAEYLHGSSGVPGVEPAAPLARRQRDAAQSRAQLLGDAAQVEQLARCEILRGQLAVASRSATQQMWLVWGCPAVWPVDLLTLLLWPIDETGRARAIWEAAERIEMAYQRDTATFLSTCESVQSTDVGRAFMSVQAPQRTKSTGVMAN